MTYTQKIKAGRKLSTFYDMAFCNDDITLVELFYNEALYWVY